jgi:hypothetical protein
MPKFKDLIEWDYAGTRYSLYVKHFIDDDGKKGMTLLFEDITHEKVTEMVIPPRMFPAFLQAVNAGMERYRGLF